MSHVIRTTSDGFVERIETASLKPVAEFDSRTGDHLWAMFGAWKCDPVKATSGEQAILDHENLLTIQGPACLFCEREYTPLLASRRCKGEPS